MTVDVTRSRSVFGQDQWDEVNIPESYRAEVVDNELVVTPKVAGTVPPISVEEWRSVSVPESYRAEVVRSELVVSPPPPLAHGRAQIALLLLLRDAVPGDHEVLIGMEWLHTGADGHVTGAPQPDLMVIPIGANVVTDPPLLAVEVLSALDGERLAGGSGPVRIEGKRGDYAANGVAHHLEVDLTAGGPVVVRYEARDGVLVEVDRAEGGGRLTADRPFPYEVVPDELLDR